MFQLQLHRTIQHESLSHLRISAETSKRLESRREVVRIKSVHRLWNCQPIKHRILCCLWILTARGRSYLLNACLCFRSACSSRSRKL